MSLSADLFATAIEAVTRRPEGKGTPFTVAVHSILRYPVKLIAAFLTAPLLAFRVATIARDPLRRVIAGLGLFFAMLAAWAAGTFLGSVAGALLIYSFFGLWWGIGFLVGTSLSIVLSVAFSVLVLNATAWLFLQISSEEVVEYLRRVSR